MQTLSLAVADPSSTGERIALPWGLDDKISFHTQEIAVLAGAPAAGKSTIAVNLAVALRVPLLYLAQDTPYSVMVRMLALSMGEDTARMYQRLEDPADRRLISERMRDRNEGLVLNRGPVSVDHIGSQLAALSEWIGRPPPVVFVDNLIDLDTQGTNPSEGGFYAQNLQELKQLAVRMDVGIILLHHVTRGAGVDHGRGKTGMKMNDLLYAGEREARHVWGVYNNGTDTMWVQVLKQTDGEADPEGEMKIPLHWQPSRGKVGRRLTGVYSG